MRHILIFLMTISAMAAEVLLPENTQFQLAWDAPEPSEEVRGFKIYTTKNFTNQISTNIVLGQSTYTTNKVWQFPTNSLLTVSKLVLTETLPGFPKGLNAIAVSAVDALTNESELSEPLIIRALGKPSPPQGMRKL